MNFIISGGTGFVGSHLTNHLTSQEHHVYIITRSPENFENTDFIHYISYDIDPQSLPQMKAVINLAGESLFGIWTKEKKERILTSRLSATDKIIALMEKMPEKPDVFISGSAVGFYGTSDEYIYTEKTEKPGSDFLATVVTKWEEAASRAETLGIRTVYTRFGIVLDEKSGSFPLMVLPVKLLAGGKIGSGEQWISWVHIKDAIQLIDFTIFNEEIRGPLNVTAPYPVRNKTFYHQLAKVLKRPYWLPTPKVAMKAAMGEMSQLITEGQYVEPKKALEHGFQFQFPTIKGALKDILIK